ncbi:hypothetical protein ZIOFF_005782 [Zingiber officinale]|uniref:Uncharacterized protein n=1 Tax=Zingiber officinale TaxID=94328 RepID=A0A8J5IBC9_ZINOF|nr:hypothetical protein ZIOFF_005782 [Zingiber officinale]
MYVLLPVQPNELYLNSLLTSLDRLQRIQVSTTNHSAIDPDVDPQDHIRLRQILLSLRLPFLLLPPLQEQQQPGKERSHLSPPSLSDFLCSSTTAIAVPPAAEHKARQPFPAIRIYIPIADGIVALVQIAYCVAGDVAVRDAGEAEAPLGRSLTFAEDIWFRYTTRMPDYLLFCGDKDWASPSLTVGSDFATVGLLRGGGLWQLLDSPTNALQMGVLLLGIPSFAGPAMVPCHMITFWLWIALRQLELIETHNGYVEQETCEKRLVQRYTSARFGSYSAGEELIEEESKLLTGITFFPFIFGALLTYFDSQKSRMLEKVGMEESAIHGPRPTSATPSQLVASPPSASVHSEFQGTTVGPSTQPTHDETQAGPSRSQRSSYSYFRAAMPSEWHLRCQLDAPTSHLTLRGQLSTHWKESLQQMHALPVPGFIKSLVLSQTLSFLYQENKSLKDKVVELETQLNGPAIDDYQLRGEIASLDLETQAKELQMLQVELTQSRSISSEIASTMAMYKAGENERCRLSKGGAFAFPRV